ncbi:hypothetical protein EVAR_98878_1 [Eumeta japonica]|uniref:Uncharacterized protein n=1 Tax=Eumeta variegata TaxID=151549 RepID=A0A4C2AFY4_EUMVA|nr:hypothetical protein EVAR_98878_1 [Eumeta japonica]
MSILHTLAPVVGRDESDDKSTTDIASGVRPTTHECRRRVTCAMDDAWRKSRHRHMSQETVTGRFLPSLPGAVSGGRVGKGAWVDDLTNG